MKEFLKRIGRGLLRFLSAARIFIVAAIIGCIIWLITKNLNIGILTGFGIVAAFAIFLWLRQAWWWIMKKGDYEKNNNTEG